MESLLGHMKDELEYKDCTSIGELRARVNEYNHFYNAERYQWTLKRMTPNEFLYKICEFIRYFKVK